MAITLDGTNGITFNNSTVQASAGQVLQVVQVVKTDTFTTTSSSFTDVTGLSVSITPKFATSKILVLYSSVMATLSGQYTCSMRLVRNSTGIYVGDAEGTRTRASNMYWSEASSVYGSTPVNGIFLDSPATTSATTYKLQVFTPYSVSVYINRTQTDSDSPYLSRLPSQITVMEIAG